MSARNTIPSHTHTHTHIKVTPPAVPETPFITGDLNLFTMPYMKGAQDLPLPPPTASAPHTPPEKKFSNVSGNITFSQGLKMPGTASPLF